jgi:hypothetical protein
LSGQEAVTLLLDNISKEDSMKNFSQRPLVKKPLVLLLGIIAIGAVIGLGLIGCDDFNKDKDTSTNDSGLNTSMSQSSWENWFNSHSASNSNDISTISAFVSKNSVWISSNPWWNSLYTAWMTGGNGNGGGGKPATLASNATYSQTIAKLDEIINYSGTPETTKSSAQDYKTAWQGDSSVQANWSSFRLSYVPLVNSLIATILGNGGGGLSTPTGPTGLRVTYSDSSRITISWNSASGAESYKIYRGDAFGGMPLTASSSKYIGSSSSTSYTDSTVIAYSDYYYQVSAVFPGGSESPISLLTGYVSGTSMSKPMNLRVTGSTADSISLSWDSVEGADRYYVYRSDSPDGLYEDILGFTSLTITSYTNRSSALQPNTTYYYKVAGRSSTTSLTPGPKSDYVQGTTSF